MTNEQAFKIAKELTAENNHQEAVLTIAKHFKCVSIAKAVTGVIMIHEARLQMEPPMIEMMGILRNDLCDLIEIRHGKEVRQAVYRCF